MQPAECLDNLSDYMQSYIESRTYLNKNDPKLFKKVVSYLYLVKLSKDEKSREPPRFEGGTVFLREQNEEDNLTDSAIEVEFCYLIIMIIMKTKMIKLQSFRKIL